MKLCCHDWVTVELTSVGAIRNAVKSKEGWAPYWGDEGHALERKVCLKCKEIRDEIADETERIVAAARHRNERLAIANAIIKEKQGA